MASWWLSFDDAAGRSLAFSEALPGYPVWPMALDVALDFVSVPLAPLPPGAASILALTFRIPEAPLGSLSSAVLRLYAPLGYSFNCSLEAPNALLALPAEESLPVANASCEPAAGSNVRARLVMQLAAAGAALEADVNYSFTVAVEIPAVLTTATEEATRWYFSLQAADTALGGPATQPWGLQELALSLSVPSASPGSAAPLQTALKLNQLLSSPKEGSVLACIELVAGEGYAFTSTCTVSDGIAPGGEAGQNPPAGCSCGISAGVASICLPNGGYFLADVWYHFVLNSVLLPAGLARRLTSSSGWSARAVTARGREVSRYLPGASAAAELNSVPRLEIFAFTSAAAAAETRRLGAVYVAAFSFKAAETTASAAARLLLTAPTGLQFMADTDCSPDSSAALLPLPSASEAAFSGGRVLPVGWCTATRRTSEQTLLLASDLPAVQSTAFPSALINLAKPLVDFRFRYLFRVAVQHPMVQPSYGIHVWVLSLLDDNWNMVAQRGDLGGYALVGELSLSVETTSRLLSSPGRPEEGNLTVQFQLSLAVEGGDLLFRLASGFRFPLLRHFSAPGSSLPADENATTTATTTTATHTGEPEVRCSVYPTAGLVVLTVTCDPQAGELRLTTERLQAGTSYSFQLEVANPEEANNTQPFEFQSFNAGELLDAGAAPSFVFAGGRLPFLALRTEPARPLADRAAGRLHPPSAFLLPANSTCEHFDAANEEGRSALPTALLAALPRAWAEVQGCSLAATPGGGPEIRITLPGALKGQRSYAFAVTAQSPIVEPPSDQNIWHLEVWVKSVAAQRLLYVGDGQGFPLVPKLQESTVYPFRALGDAYLTQSFLLPRGASLVSLRVEFAIPFVSPGSLGQRLEVAVEAPEGFSLGSGGSCEVRSLQLGRDVVPESWPAELEGIGNQLTYKAEIFPALPPVDAEGAENRLWNLRAFACTTSMDPLQEESDAATGSLLFCCAASDRAAFVTVDKLERETLEGNLY
ncbi:mpv17 [Symbiodinium sp. CCMP2592]|nr:mpv17 [Symbiodinium sp. CCMP2592]